MSVIIRYRLTVQLISEWTLLCRENRSTWYEYHYEIQTIWKGRWRETHSHSWEAYYGNWRSTVTDVKYWLQVPLNKGPSRMETGGTSRMIISVTGSGPSKVLPTNDLYFAREGMGRLIQIDIILLYCTGTTELRGGVRLNEVGDSSIEKLGWLRKNDKGWTVPNGVIKITQAHVNSFFIFNWSLIFIQHVKVVNCKEQRFLSALNADQYVSSEDGKKQLHVSYGRSISSYPDYIHSTMRMDCPLHAYGNRGKSPPQLSGDSHCVIPSLSLYS